MIMKFHCSLRDSTVFAHLLKGYAGQPFSNVWKN